MTTTYLNPQHGQTYPQPGQTRTRVVFDGGNRFIKWIDPNNQVQCIPSCVKEVTEHQWKRIKPDARTVLIEVDDKRYVIGRLAQDLGGEPTFQKDKCELAEILALVAIQPNPGLDSVRISKLAVALPNSLNDSDVAAVKRISNHPLTKSFKRNCLSINYTIGEVEPLDETYPAFLYAQQQQLFSFSDVKNAVWDIGGGTSIARIYTANGTLIHEAEVILPGTKHLAQQIAVELKEENNLDYSPNLTDIMDAIQRKDYLYGTAQLDFWSIYDHVCSAWVESARDEIRSKWVNHLPQLGEVLVVGGSAEIARPICESTGDRFFIPENPQLFNIIAMAHLQ